MLVLTRRPEEQIIIDGNIRITVLSVVGNKVRIGIDAPPSVRVNRSEIIEDRKPACDKELELTLAPV